MAYGNDSSVRRESAKLGVRGVYNRNNELIHGLRKEEKEDSADSSAVLTEAAKGGAQGAAIGMKLGGPKAAAVAGGINALLHGLSAHQKKKKFDPKDISKTVSSYDDLSRVAAAKKLEELKNAKT